MRCYNVQRLIPPLDPGLYAVSPLRCRAARHARHTLVPVQELLPVLELHSVKHGAVQIPSQSRRLLELAWTGDGEEGMRMTSWTVGFCYGPVFGWLACIQGVVCRHGRLLAASPDLQHVVRIELRPLGLRRRRSALGGVDGVPIVVCVRVRRDHPQERACDSAAVQPVVSSPDPSCMLCWSKPDHLMMYPLLAAIGRRLGRPAPGQPAFMKGHVSTVSAA